MLLLLLAQSLSPALIRANREHFLKYHDSSPEASTLVHLVYEEDDYCRYKTVDQSFAGDGMARPPSFEADGLVTTTPGLALFLPLADCTGVVLHDPTQNILMLTHLGRHNLEQFGGSKSVEYLVNIHGVNPANLTAWLSPAAGKDNYPLFAFENRSMHDVAIEQLRSRGIVEQNITSSDIDTTKDSDYFSHSQFLKNNLTDDGRFAIVAVMQ